MTLAVSAAEASSVARLMTRFSSGAKRRWPVSANNALPNNGIPSSNSISMSVFLELFHMPYFQTVERLADLEEENAENEHADQHIQRNPQFHHHGHAISGAGGGEEQAVFHR